MNGVQDVTGENYHPGSIPDEFSVVVDISPLFCWISELPGQYVIKHRAAL